MHLCGITRNPRIGCGFNIVPMWHPLRLAEDYAMVFVPALHELDPRMVPNRGRNAAVASKQPRVEHFCQGNVNGIVSRKVVPQFPDPLQQHVVGVATQREILKNVDSDAAASGPDLAGRGVAPQHLGYLDIDQMRRVQRKSLIVQPFLNGDGCRCVQQCFEKRRGVDHGHSASRSARTAASGEVRGFVGEPCASRWRSSSTVGQSAMRRSSASR